MTNQILNGPVFLYIKLSQLAVKTKIYIYICIYGSGINCIQLQ